MAPSRVRGNASALCFMISATGARIISTIWTRRRLTGGWGPGPRGGFSGRRDTTLWRGTVNTLAHQKASSSGPTSIRGTWLRAFGFTGTTLQNRRYGTVFRAENLLTASRLRSSTISSRGNIGATTRCTWTGLPIETRKGDR